MGSTEHRVVGLCEVTVTSSNVRPKFRGLSTFPGGCQNRSRSSTRHGSTSAALQSDSFWGYAFPHPRSRPTEFGWMSPSPSICTPFRVRAPVIMLSIFMAISSLTKSEISNTSQREKIDQGSRILRLSSDI